MNDYMTALYQRFFQEPDFTELEEEIEQTRQEVRDCLGKLQRRKLMQLVDAQSLLREKTSMASFIAALSWPGALQKNWKQTACTLSTTKKNSGPAKQQNRR